MEINRRKLLSLIGISPAILAGASASADAESQAQNNARIATHKHLGAGSSEYKITGLNPRGVPPPITLIPMAPRLATLDGKTVYLVDTGFHGSDTLLEQVAGWFSRNKPSVTTVFRRKAGPYAEDDPKLWAEIKEKGNAVIMAVGH
ncbi:MAG TPA: hypothetical protein VHX49_10900 [Candidatus Acidoferrales bacterium]|jgi:hypothetical protein|nr:hypothetical protein [Candidatus Acidoferrales bacterium]